MSLETDGSIFLAEIGIASFDFAPKGFAMCNGQLLPINQNQALFSLLGTNYGGDGRVNFALPDLQGRVPIHAGSGRGLGVSGGEQAHTIILSELTTHTHIAQASSANGNQPTVPNTLIAAANNLWTNPSQFTAIAPSTVTNSGGGQAHQNMQPYLVLTFCIALQGIFPSPD